MPDLSEAAVLESARRTFDIESCAISGLADRLGNDFVAAVRLLVELKGHVVVTGVGKSGAVGRKIGGTLASTGTPAVFMHAVEAVHGDLGIITGDDVALLLSNSGETEEVMRLIPALKRRRTPIIAIVGNTTSTIGQQADVALDAAVREEACPLGLAPTASTAAQLAMGDALAMAAMEARGYSSDDYAEHHPAGSLGRRVMLRVCDIMHSGDSNPVVSLDATVLDAVLTMTRAPVRGVVSIVDTSRKLKGLFTDGDFRILMQREPDRNAVMAMPISRVMTLRPTTVAPDCSAAEAVRIMQDREFDNLPVVDADGVAVGVVDIQDIIREGVV
ncbi:MAG: KpsF/GutQ family sugar-phosphate isomerase [Armatimonadetes bacterium]|nr:KpsF/GutQ family sugar-phosphate isomerase [Armatimonadota bacterium]